MVFGINEQELQQILQSAGNLPFDVNLGPWGDQRDVANAAMTGETICGPQCAGIGAAIVEAINFTEWLVSIFQGVPRTQKTIITGQRMMLSDVAALQMLGLWWSKAGGANIVDSNAPDITTYFQPAFNYTIQTLNIPFAAPDWYALSQVIGEGQPASVFDQSYGAQNRATPMFVTQEAFHIQYPGQRYPDELVTVYKLRVPDFVQGKQPGQPPPGGGNGQPGGPPPGGGTQNGGGETSIECCDRIVIAIQGVVAGVQQLPNEQGLANMPGITVALQQISASVSVLVNEFGNLMQGLGGGTQQLAQTLADMSNTLSATVTNAAGEEVTALNAVATSIVNALGRIDQDSENSLAGISKAIANIPKVDLKDVVDALKCICADQPVREFIRAMGDQQLAPAEIVSAVLAALPQTVS